MSIETVTVKRRRSVQCVLCLVACLALSQAAVAEPAKTDTLCLYADTPAEAPAPSEICDGNDAADLASNADVRRAMTTLGIAGLKILFSGCEGGKFATSSVTGVSTPRVYHISYPLLSNASPGSKNSTPHSLYLAPITHELSHVLQIERSGGYNELINSREIRSIELGADFLSGIVFSRTKSMDQLNIYETDLNLVGNYKEDKKKAHGTWEQRTSAFRRGAFLKPEPTPITLRDADASFDSKYFPIVLEMGRSLMSGQSPRPPAVTWDKISACSEVSALYEKLKSNSERLLSSCRSAHSDLENATAKAYSVKFGIEPCFLKESPSPILSEFSCFQPRDLPQTLECIRPADKQIILDHFDDKQKKEGASYMAKTARECGPGVDSSVALPTMFSAALNSIFNFEFAYARSVGSGIPADGEMIHGIASVDQSITTPGVEAVEYVSMFANGSVTGPALSDASQKIQIGSWQFQVEDITGFDSFLNRQFKKRNIPALFTTKAFTVSRTHGAAATENARTIQGQAWEAILTNTIEEEYFTQIPISDLRMADGQDPMSAFQAAQSALQTGGKKRVGDSVTPAIFSVFHAQNIRPCTKSGAGEIFAFIFVTKVSPADASDYGSITIGLLGAGNCSKSIPANTTYYSELLDNLADAVQESLKEQK